MAKVITLSRSYPSYHPKAGQPTYFVTSAWNSIPKAKTDDLLALEGPVELIKHHTVRLGRRWKDGDMASLRVWSERPYNSPQIKIADDVKVRVVDIWVDYDNLAVFRSCGVLPEICTLSGGDPDLDRLASNDGLSVQDFLDWFQVGKKKGVVEAQILIWGDVKEY